MWRGRGWSRDGKGSEITIMNYACQEWEHTRNIDRPTGALRESGARALYV